MTAKLIKGNEIAQQIREELKQEAVQFREKYNLIPSMVTIVVGENPGSLSDLIAKHKTCKELGFSLIQDIQLETITELELLKLINKYNTDSKIHGVLVQLPQPKHIDEISILYAIDPQNDIDGFHPANVGKLVIGEADCLPCTAAGIQQLLIRSGIKIDGAEVVVVGRSNLVGKPIANILLQKQRGANATVTICHSDTKEMTFHTRRADILIVAEGKPKAITANMVKEGVVVIDAGFNWIGMTPEGKAKLCGGVDFDSVKEKASAITPVPGGVGPMTVTMLMMNMLKAAKIAEGFQRLWTSLQRSIS